MLSELQDIESNLEEIFERLENKLNGFETLEESKKYKEIKICNRLCEEISREIDYFEIEFSYLDRVQIVPFKFKHKIMTQRHVYLEQILQTKQFKVTQGNLLLPEYDEGQKNSLPKQEIELVTFAREVQKKGLNSLKNTYEKLLACDEEADKINETLRIYNTKLADCRINVQDTKSDMIRAKEYIRYFVDDLKKDVIVKILIVAIILIISLIFIFKMRRFLSGDDSSENLPADIIEKPY